MLGKNIFAMQNNYTSVKEMLQMLGVEPTDEIVNEATEQFALNGDEITMNGLYEFLKTKTIMSKLTSPLKKHVIADIRTAPQAIDLR